MTTTAPSTFTPARDLLHVRLLRPADRTAGGVLLPETAQVNSQEGQVIAVGPGRGEPVAVRDGDLWPIEPTWRTTMWADVGDHILFRKHHFHPLTPDSREGIVRDTDVIALINRETGEIGMCLGEWVLVEPDAFVAQKGSLLVPEIDQRKPPSGRIVKWGPGRLSETVPYLRMTVPWLLDVPEDRMRGLRVWWTRRSEDVLEVGREVTTGTLVQVRDILCVEE